ncbi:MAG: hemin uptake protein HemP [Pseudomonadota bacterium]
MTRIDLTPRTASSDEAPKIPVHDAESLLGGGRKAAIVLGDQIYTLQITKQGKLLLTK